jgi:hypothetical protein
MGKICEFAQEVDADLNLYLCSKYKSYCYLDEPNRKNCIEIYGSEYKGEDIQDDEENLEDCI